MAVAAGGDPDSGPDEGSGLGRVDPDHRTQHARYVFWQVVAVEWPGEELVAVSDSPTPPPEGGWPEIPDDVRDLVPEEAALEANPEPPRRPQRRRRAWDPATWFQDGA